MDVKEKSEIVLRLVKEIVEETQSRNDKLGGFMRTFGNDYILRTTTFSNFFKETL